MRLIRILPWALMGLGTLGVLAVLAPGGASTLGLTEQPASLWQWLVGSVFLEQQALHRELAGAVREAGRAGVAAAWGLIVISFLYGVFHAAGPGHGKAILTTYLLAEGTEKRRGLLLAFASSMTQGVVAALVVYGLIYLVGLVPRDARAAMMWSERASFLLVMALGLWLLIRTLRQLRARAGSAHAHAHAHHDHDHGHHAHEHHAHEHDAHAHHDHDHEGACCDHSHGPDLAGIRKANSLRAGIGVVLSIGLRPCTGAILVLILAQAAGIAWAGLTAVFAMSLGTALAIAGLAWATVGARDWISGLPAGSADFGRVLGQAAGIGGGLLLLALGANLFWASFGAMHPLGL